MEAERERSNDIRNHNLTPVNGKRTATAFRVGSETYICRVQSNDKEACIFDFRSLLIFVLIYIQFYIKYISFYFILVLKIIFVLVFFNGNQ